MKFTAASQQFNMRLLLDNIEDCYVVAWVNKFIAELISFLLVGSLALLVLLCTIGAVGLELEPSFPKETLTRLSQPMVS